MIKTSILIDNYKSALSGLSWVSDYGGGITKFKGVFTHPNWNNDVGYPFAVVLDGNHELSQATNCEVEGTYEVRIYVCVGLSGNDTTTASEGVFRRLREASDTLREFIADEQNIKTMLSQPKLAYDQNKNVQTRVGDITVENIYMEQANIHAKLFTLRHNEIINY